MEKRPFTSDGCSGGMSWLFGLLTGGDKLPWHAHCVVHTKQYWLGGTKEDRRKADLELMREIEDYKRPMSWLIVDPYENLAECARNLMIQVLACAIHDAVRIFGHPWWPFPWRWDYGRSWPGKYEPRTIDIVSVSCTMMTNRVMNSTRVPNRGDSHENRS